MKRSREDGLSHDGLAKESSVPLYRQLEQWIRGRIDSGEMTPGDRLPSESQMSERFGISRVTVRKALERLELMGYLESHPGKGTFVARPKIPQKISMLTGFHNKMSALGLEVQSQVLDVRWTEAGLVARERLGLAKGDTTYQITRLRLVDGTPAALQVAHVPTRLCPDLDRMDLTGSLTNLMEERYGLKLRRYAAEMEAEVASASEATLLKVSAFTPLLKIHSVAFAERGLPVRYSVGWYRGDRLKFTVDDYDIVADVPGPGSSQTSF